MAKKRPFWYIFGTKRPPKSQNFYSKKLAGNFFLVDLDELVRVENFYFFDFWVFFGTKVFYFFWLVCSTEKVQFNRFELTQKKRFATPIENRENQKANLT